MPYDKEGFTNYIRIYQRLLADAIKRGIDPRKAEYLTHMIKRFDNAMAIGRFDKAKALLGPDVIQLFQRKLPGPIGGKAYTDIRGAAMYSKPAMYLKAYIKGLDRQAGISLNSPLLDMFGPVQADRSMRTLRNMRSRYLQDGGT